MNVLVLAVMLIHDLRESAEPGRLFREAFVLVVRVESGILSIHGQSYDLYNILARCIESIAGARHL